jgi:hypothetical protein
VKRFITKAQVVWGYASELLLTGLICWLIGHKFGTSAIQAFIFDTAQQWSSLADYLFAAGAAIWIAVFASIMLTSFGRYLRDQGATGVYLSATAVPMGVFLVADIVVKLTVVYKLGWLSYAAFVFLLYSLINFLTLVKNIVELVSFYLAYQATHPGTPNPPDELQKNHTR